MEITCFLVKHDKKLVVSLVYDDKMYHNAMGKLVYMLVVNKYYLIIIVKRFLVV